MGTSKLYFYKHVPTVFARQIVLIFCVQTRHKYNVQNLSYFILKHTYTNSVPIKVDVEKSFKDKLCAYRYGLHIHVNYSKTFH